MHVIAMAVVGSCRRHCRDDCQRYYNNDKINVYAWVVNGVCMCVYVCADGCVGGRVCGWVCGLCVLSLLLSRPVLLLVHEYRGHYMCRICCQST